MRISSILVETGRGHSFRLALCHRRRGIGVDLIAAGGKRRSGRGIRGYRGLSSGIFDWRFLLKKVAKAGVEFSERICRFVGA